MSVEGEQEVELSMSSTRLRVETRARLDRFSAPRRHAALLRHCAATILSWPIKLKLREHAKYSAVMPVWSAFDTIR
jgi:hypothetical protein